MLGRRPRVSNRSSSGLLVKARVGFVSAMLLVSTALVFRQLPQNGFIELDDADYITGNPHVLAGLTWESLWWATRSAEFSNWHPVTWVSHMIDAQLFGANPGGHHLVSLLIHAANALLLLLLLLRMTGALWKSAFVAIFFALHPLHVEPVAWAAERKELLSAFFAFSTLLAYVAYRRRRGWVRYVPVPLLFALALAAKPMAVTLPFLILVLELWPLGRWQAPVEAAAGPSQTRRRDTLVRAALETSPLFVLATISSIVTLAAQRAGGMVKPVGEYPLGLRLQSAAVAYGDYLLQTVWPAGLAFPTSHPGAYPAWQVAAALGALLLLSGLAFRGRRRFPFLPVGWSWYLGMLVPVSGLIQIADQGTADRYTYLPLVGIFVALVWGGERLCAALPGERAYAAAIAVAASVVLAVLSARQTHFWRSAETVFSRAVSVSPANYLAEYNLGSTLIRNGKPAEAVPHLRKALNLRPNYVDALNNLGYALQDLGQVEEAKRAFIAVIHLRPQSAEAYNNLGVALINEGRFKEAEGYLRTVVRLQPSSGAAHNNLGSALFSQGRKDEARARYREALRLNPDDRNARENLEQALAPP